MLLLAFSKDLSNCMHALFLSYRAAESFSWSLALTKIILYFQSVHPPHNPPTLSLSALFESALLLLFDMWTISRGCSTNLSLLFSHLSSSVTCRRGVTCERGSTNIAILKWFCLSPVVAVIVYYDCEFPFCGPLPFLSIPVLPAEFLIPHIYVLMWIW